MHEKATYKKPFNVRLAIFLNFVAAVLFAWNFAELLNVSFNNLLWFTFFAVSPLTFLYYFQDKKSSHITDNVVAKPPDICNISKDINMKKPFSKWSVFFLNIIVLSFVTYVYSDALGYDFLKLFFFVFFGSMLLNVFIYFRDKK